MKKFIVKVNGNSYEVEVEEVTSGVAPSNYDTTSQNTAEIQPMQQSVQTKPQTPSRDGANTGAASKSAPAGATTVKAPMPGTILDINVNTGDTVEKGQVLCILEAMKMENEIMSPKDGKIASVNTSKGASVDAGDLLFSIE